MFSPLLLSILHGLRLVVKVERAWGWYFYGFVNLSGLGSPLVEGSLRLVYSDSKEESVPRVQVLVLEGQAKISFEALLT